MVIFFELGVESLTEPLTRCLIDCTVIQLKNNPSPWFAVRIVAGIIFGLIRLGPCTVNLSPPFNGVIVNQYGP
jgi:hypothetical protein